MATPASGSAVKYYYTAEDAAGAIAAVAPVFKPIRYNTADLSRNTTQIDSNEINPSRQRPASRQGTFSIEGSIVSEVSFGSFDDLFEALLQGTWAPKSSLTGITFSVDASDNSINDSASGFVTAGFVVGDSVTTTGFTTAANNSTFIVTAVAADKLTIGGVDGDALVTEAAGDIVTVRTTASNVLQVGSTQRTFAILERHTDINAGYLYRGVRISGATLALPLNSMARITFNVLGENQEVFTVPGDAVFNAATTTQPMVTTAGLFTDNAVTIGYATDYNLTVDNGMAASFVLFRRSAYGVSNGAFTASGTLDALFPDPSLFNKVINETQSAHVIEVVDGVSTYRVTLPLIQYTNGTKAVGGPGEITTSITFGAGPDAVLGTTMQLERIA